MKVNKLWIVILVILIVGCWTTSYTKRYRDQLIGAAVIAAEQEGTPETAAVLGAAVSDGGMEEQEDAADIPSLEAPEVQAVQESAAGTAASADSVSETVDGGQAGTERMSFGETVSETEADTAMARAALPVPEAADGERTNSYLNRLNDLDARLKEEQGTAADTTNSMKAASEQERKLWETELNRILDALEERLPNEEMQELFKAQKEWMRDRESIAVDSSKKKSGSTLEEVEYNISLADTTRSRAYELAEQYASVLTGAE